jgi:NADP-dependent 3-hydroxy acid dehydrogenase YdfG
LSGEAATGSVAIVTNDPIGGTVVVITGASSGIGEATARLLAARGAALVLGARRIERLEAIAGGLRSDGARILTRATDVARPDAVEGLAGAAADEFGRLDVLVFNAGISKIGPMGNGDVAAWSSMIGVNGVAS